MKKNIKEFKIAVKRILIEADMTQADLASQLGITSAYLSDILNGNRGSQEMRDRILNVLQDISIDYVVNRK